MGFAFTENRQPHTGRPRGSPLRDYIIAKLTPTTAHKRICGDTVLYICVVKYNPELHHRRSIRLRDYDYANTGAYFVTICCKDRVNYFGEIVNEKMILNEYGNIAYNEWEKLQERYLENKFDVFQIMPDHIHGIIEINVGATLAVAQTQKTKIGRIVGAYKSLVFARCLEISNEDKCVLGKLWQRNYWEHIIRNETEYANIREYIRDNPILWGKKRLSEILPFALTQQHPTRQTTQ